MGFFLKKRHSKFFKNCLKMFIPQSYSSLDSSRMTVAFFGISGLDILSELNVLSSDDRNELVNWIYSLQILQSEGGFRGSTCNGSSDDDCSHVAMTYSALLSLIILGDDLSRVNKESVMRGLRSLQLPNGCFLANKGGSESDMRFVYCVTCICYVLSDWSGMDVDFTTSYIRNSLSYEGAFAQGPGQEAHGGSTYCAVASLILMDKLDEVLDGGKLRRLKEWCLFRQSEGFNGRPNKPDDTCYSFWVGATLKLLDMFHLVSFEKNREFLMETQDVIVGGFSKWPDHPPDALHAYFGVCGLSLMGEPDLEVMEPALNISRRAFNHLLNIHENWSSKSNRCVADDSQKTNSIQECSQTVLDHTLRCCEKISIK